MTPADVPAGPVLVDTDVFSWIAWKRHRYQEFEQLLSGHLLAISFATVAELRAGALIGEWGRRRIADLEKLMHRYVIIPATDEVTRKWADIYSELHDQLRGGGINDMWIAACAISAQPAPLPVATGNLSDFSRIAGVFPIQVIHPDL